MKIKKLLVGALAAVTMASAVGVSNTPVFAAEAEAVSTVDYSSVSHIKAYPDKSLKEETHFDFNGISYAYDESSDTYFALAISSPHLVKYLVIYSHMFDKVVDCSQLDLSVYTNVIRLVINANNPEPYYEMMKGLTKEFSLYLTGQLIFNEHVKDLNIRNLYSVPAYYVSSDMIEPENLGYLSESTIDAVYNYRFTNNNFWAYNTGSFDEYAITNADGTALTMNIASESDLMFDLDVFYPYEGYKVNVPYLGASGFNQVEDLTNDGLVKNKMSHFIRSIDSKVQTFYFDYDGFLGNDFSASTNTFVIKHYDGQSFLNSNFEELVLFNDYDDYTFTDFKGAKTIRFVSPDETGGVVWNGVGKNINYIQNIETILVPEEFAETHYSILINDADLGPKVQTYDESTYQVPTRSSFLSDNGTVYEVEDQSLLLADLEADIAVMTEAGKTPTADTPVDLQIAAFYNSDNTTEPDTGDDNGNEGDTGNSGSTDTGNDDVTGDVVFGDESEFTTGVHTMGSLIYSSSRDLEEILKIAGNFAVWNDGELGDHSEYRVVLHEQLGRLGVTLYDSENNIVKSVSFYIKQVDSTYGEFIYVELFGTTRGVLLVDIDENRTTDINELYDFVLGNAINASYVEETNVEDFTFAEANIKEVDSYYTHAVAEQNFVINTQVICQDYELLTDMDNIEVTIAKVINPDDDIEDAESEYSIKYIEKIYVPASVNGPAIPHCIKEMLLYKNGKLSNEEIVVTYSHGSNINTEDYSFYCYITLPDGVRYIHKIEVEMIDIPYQVGFCLFEDGTLAAVTPYQAGTTKEELSIAVNSFVKDVLEIAEPNVVLADKVLNDTSLNTGSTYADNKTLVTLMSGVASLAYSTEDNPVDNSALKEGYNAMTNLYFTDNYDVNDVVKAIGNKILLKEGIIVDTKYTVKVTVFDTIIAWEFYIGEDKVHSTQTSYHIVKDSTVGNFIYASAFEFKTGMLLLEKGNTNDFQDIYAAVIDRCHYTMTPPTTDTILDLTKIGKTIVREVHQLGDFNYYNVETTVYVVDIDNEVADTVTEIITPVNPNPDQGGNTGDSGNSGDSGNTGNQGGNTGDSGNTGEQPDDGKDETPDDGKDTIDDIKDKVNDWFEDFKTKFEENKAVKAATIAFGCITGILLIYGIYVIFKKLFKWLGR